MHQNAAGHSLWSALLAQQDNTSPMPMRLCACHALLEVFLMQLIGYAHPASQGHFLFIMEVQVAKIVLQASIKMGPVQNFSASCALLVSTVVLALVFVLIVELG